MLAKLVMYPMGFFTPCVIGPFWLKAVTSTGGSVRADFERVLALDFDNLISAHGTSSSAAPGKRSRRTWRSCHARDTLADRGPDIADAGALWRRSDPADPRGAPYVRWDAGGPEPPFVCADACAAGAHGP